MPALNVKALAHKAPVHHCAMPIDKPWPEPATVFQANLQAMVATERSVNAWAIKHKLSQTTINRLIHGQDPKLSMIIAIAEKFGLTPSQLLTEDLRAPGDEVVRLRAQVDELMEQKNRVLLTLRGEAGTLPHQKETNISEPLDRRKIDRRRPPQDDPADTSWGDDLSVEPKRRAGDRQ